MKPALSPPIAKLAERLMLDIELAVRQFPRYHKYQCGAVLRTQAMDVMRLVNRAWRDRSRQAQWVEKLVWAVDELKLTLQLGKQLQAFRSFAQFEQLARAQVPMHKRLEAAAPGCGLPIGNLFSQFGSNVQLDPLDQFIQRRLGARRYVRYVDDFVIAHNDREQLVRWQAEIETFLRDELRLRLKDEVKLAPLTEGIDFLGYVLHPRYTRVRRRVVMHAREKLHDWQREHVRADVIEATPAELREIVSIWASYDGHFRRANSQRLVADFHRRYPWLHDAVCVHRRFDHRLEGRRLRIETGACA